MNNKISNVRFEEISSIKQGFREVRVTFLLNEKEAVYFIFIKEDKKVNYLSEAKQIFEQDLKSGLVYKTIKQSKKQNRPVMVWCAAALGAAAIAVSGVVAWKYLTTKPEVTPDPTIESFKITVDAGEGKFLDDETTRVIEASKGTKIISVLEVVTPPKSLHEDFVFSGFCYQDKSEIKETDVLTKDVTVVANYEGPEFSSIFYTCNKGE